MTGRETAPAPLNSRFAQMFPMLSASELQRVAAFGVARRYGDGELIVETGKVSPGMIVILSGHVAITQRDGLGHVKPVVDHGPGQFIAEVGAAVRTRRRWSTPAPKARSRRCVIPPEQLRGLLVAEAELGERIMRALILRRVGLIAERHRRRRCIVGAADAADVTAAARFPRPQRPAASRCSIPTPIRKRRDADRALRTVAARSAAGRACPTAQILRNPGETELARAASAWSPRARPIALRRRRGRRPDRPGWRPRSMPPRKACRSIVLDARAFGGQAGASARIENYLGFPTGISGLALAGRAFVQAQKFGAEMMIPVEVKMLDCARERRRSSASTLEGGETDPRALGRRRQRRALPPAGDRESCRASRARRLVLGLADRGAALRQRGGGPGRRRQFGRPGGGVPRRPRAKVRMMVRGDGPCRHHVALSDRPHRGRRRISSCMTAYRDRRARRRDGQPRARALAQPQDRRGDRRSRSANVFLFIGADPATGWLAGCGVDARPAGFVVTGRCCGNRCQPAANQRARRLRGRRRALRLGQARRRRHRRGRAGGGGAARLSAGTGQSHSLSQRSDADGRRMHATPTRSAT